MISTNRPLQVLVASDDPEALKGLFTSEDSIQYHIVLRQQGLRELAHQRFDLALIDQDFLLLEEMAKARKECFSEGMPLLLLHNPLEGPDRIRAFNLGAVDCIFKPFEVQELASKIHNYGKSYRNQIDLEKAMILIENDLRAASVIQERLLPPDLYQTYSFLLKYRYIPSSSLAGDLVGYKLVQDALAFYVFDVMGHGVAAAMISTLISIQMNEIYFMLPQKMLDIPFVLKILDADLQSHISGDDCFYATGVYGVLHKNGLLEYALAGHPEPILVHRAKKKAQILPNLEPLCPVVGLGMIPKKVEPQRIQIQPDEHVFLYTDGILEQTNSVQEEFGIERVIETLGESTLDNPFDHLLHTLKRYSGAKNFNDDITLLSVGFTPKQNPR